MKHGKRFPAIFLLMALMISLLSGCHGSRGMKEFAMPEEFDESREYEITFWAKNDTNRNQVEVYQQTIADFEKLYPNIRVNLRLYTDYSRIYNDVIVNLTTNTTPNVCISYPDHIATYLTGSNTVVPLDELFADPEYGLGGSCLRYDGPSEEEMVPQFLAECVLDGSHYAIPFVRSTEACYVNKTYVEKLGFTLPEVLTWDFVWQVAEAATARDEEGNFLVNGQKVMLPFIYKSTDNMMIQMLHQKDAGYSTDAGDIEIFNDTTQKILETVASHAETDAFSTFKISGYPANFLNAGQCIFAVDSTAGSTWMGSDAPLLDISEEDLVDFEIAVFPVPQYDPEKISMISQGPSVCVFNKSDPQEVLASWIFAQYLLTDSVQVAYSRTEGYAPVTIKAQNSQEYLDYLSRAGEDNDMHYSVKIQALNLLTEHTENTFVTPVFNGSASLRNAAGHLIESVVKSINRNQTVDAAYYEKLYADTATLYHLDEKSASSGDPHSGPLPGASKALLLALLGIWILMGAGAGLTAIRKIRGKNQRQNH